MLTWLNLGNFTDHKYEKSYWRDKLRIQNDTKSFSFYFFVKTTIKQYDNHEHPLLYGVELDTDIEEFQLNPG